ncbi:GntR family transcriptional regulator [Leucobacter sp. wl10]|uniref:GntR family transcriptional regulator n=1 Tax=Leucobacter sp. wl10 TaxID=2304677 RepID=UPI000E5A31B0|nr:GntR family transcriptional regulator [Leucobacter sp. wl10]RGE20367.1 GntR family transcriptional regulator [Leucobacter sp. wl10]
MAGDSQKMLNGPDGRIQVPRRVAAKRESLAEGPPAPQFIADTLKHLILVGELSLGTPVTEKWMTERFQASRTTVREALNLLVAERYLDQKPYKSARVRSYSPGEVADILEARRLLEGFAADRCADATEVARAELRASFAKYASEISAQQQNSAAMAHVDLHVAIVGLTGNRELVLAEHDLMIGSLLLIDLINWHLRDSEKMYMEHLRLVNALLEPDPEEARRLTDAHLDMVLDAAHKRLPGTG